MEEKISVKIEGISKKYLLGDSERYLALRDIISKVFKLPFNVLRGKKFKKKKEFWALKDINLEVKRGEVIGIIGKNGAGKSTLLKILSRITDPTEGKITYVGRVSSLLEVGTGFHPELTGRENIYLNGAILGMSKKEIKKKIENIIEFSGIRDFIDTPVKKYSSGMQVRLAFSVAAHLDSDILIIDEVLAVGDAEFQKKCLGKMDEVTKTNGRTVFFVSHDIGAVQRLCKKTLLLEQGRVVMFDETSKVVERYLSNISTGSEYTYSSTNSSEIALQKVKTLDSNNNLSSQIPYNEPFAMEVEYKILKAISGLQIGFVFETVLGLRLFSASSADDGVYLESAIGTYKIKYIFPEMKNMYINPGMYLVRLGLGFANKKSLVTADNIVVTIKEPKEIVNEKKIRRADNVLVMGEWKK